MKEQWFEFTGGNWENEIDVRDFIMKNYRLYEGDDTFLVGPTNATSQLWDQVMDLTKQERENGGVLDMDTKIVSTITSHNPGYLNKDLETVVGVQTDVPFKRSLQPFGGIRMAELACEAYGYEVDKEISSIFRDWRKTHNQGVFDAIMTKCVPLVNLVSLQDFQMHTDVDASSVTTVVSLYTV